MPEVTISYTVQVRDTYHSICEMREDNERIGHHWFDRDNMRAFGCRVNDMIYAGHYFISSEQHKSYYPRYFCEPRKYTIRSCFEGRIDTVGEFQQYSSLRQAQAAVRKLVQS